MTTAAWWSTGFKGFDKAAEEKARQYGPRRFFIPKPKPGQYNTKDLVFLSDEPFSFWEHGYKLNGNWIGNHEVCISGITPPCPMDNLGKNVPVSKYFIGLFTILDLSEWTSEKDGKVHKYEKKVLPAKDKLAQKIRRHKEKKGSLIGTRWTLTRDAGEQTPNTGDDMEYVETLDLKQLLQTCKDHFTAQQAKQEFITKFTLDPYDFTKLIAPRSKPELEAIVASVKSGGGTAPAPSGAPAGGGSQVDEDIPF